MTGRPSKYTQELLEKAQYYLSDGYKQEEHLIPSDVGLAVYLGIARSTLYKWSKEEGKEAFSDILEALSDKQHWELMNGGLSGKLNPTITKLVLTKHGYSDKVDNTHGGPDGGPIETSHVTRTIVQP